MMALFFVFFGFSTAFGEMVCPGTPAPVHAGMEIVATASASCEYVEDEMKARIEGQFDKWHDPHHNGTYHLDHASNGTLTAHRRTGDDKYTDKMVFKPARSRRVQSRKFSVSAMLAQTTAIYGCSTAARKMAANRFCTTSRRTKSLTK